MLEICFSRGFRQVVLSHFDFVPWSCAFKGFALLHYFYRSVSPATFIISDVTLLYNSVWSFVIKPSENATNVSQNFQKKQRNVEFCTFRDELGPCRLSFLHAENVCFVFARPIFIFNIVLILYEFRGINILQKYLTSHEIRRPKRSVSCR